MYAFINTSLGLFKVYKHETDWQIIGDGFERWFPIRATDVRGSLMRAVASIPGFSIDNQLVIV